MTASPSRAELHPASSTGTRKFHNSELVSWFHGDSLAITLFILIKAWRRLAKSVSNVLATGIANGKLLGTHSRSWRQRGCSRYPSVLYALSVIVMQRFAAIFLLDGPTPRR